MSKPAFTPAMEEIIIKYVKDGKEIGEIAEIIALQDENLINVKANIAGLLRRSNIKHNRTIKKTRKLTDEQKYQIIMDRSKGVNIRELAVKYDVSTGTINNVLKDTSLKEGGNYQGIKRVLSLEQEEQIINIYNNSKKSARQIWTDGFKDKVSYQTVINTLERHNIEVKEDLKRDWINDETRCLIVKRSLEIRHIPTVAKEFDISEQSVGRIIQEYRDKGNELELPVGKPRTYLLNEHAFDILTPEVAYWVGFLIADGCISYDKYSSYLICCLAEKDREHLDKLRNFLGSTHPIRRIEKTKTSLGGPFAWFGVRSQQLTSAIAKYGMVPVKSERIPCKELLYSRDFYRGLLDGDGSLGTECQGDSVYPYFVFTGQWKLMECVRDFILLKTNNKLSIYKTNSIYRLQTTGNTASTLIECLYKNATVFLDRKNERAQSIISGNLVKFKPYVEIPSVVPINDDIEELKSIYNDC